MKKILIVILVLLAEYTYSQDNYTYEMGKDSLFSKTDTELPTKGKVDVSQDKYIQEMLSKHIKANVDHPEIDGWRVQIYFSSARDAMTKANKMKEEFELDYPNVGIYIIYQAPFFKVRVGDFRINQRTKALKFKKEISARYPTTWLVEDKINLPDIN